MTPDIFINLFICLELIPFGLIDYKQKGREHYCSLPFVKLKLRNNYLTLMLVPVVSGLARLLVSVTVLAEDLTLTVKLDSLLISNVPTPAADVVDLVIKISVPEV
ncbi:hypothetical protein D3C75_1065400 [compost metagenome]